MRTKLQRRGKRAVAAAGVICALLGGGVMNPVDSATASPRVWIDEQLAAREQLVLEQVRGVVREHRPTASDTWVDTLAEAIVEEAASEGVHPLLVASIVARESSFKSRVVSRAGAVGLMQLRPWVARDVAMRADMDWDGLGTLHAPHLNVRLGIRYYKELIDRFDGDHRAALTAYCFGPTRVARQLRDGRFEGSAYADSILDLYHRWLERDAA